MLVLVGPGNAAEHVVDAIDEAEAWRDVEMAVAFDDGPDEMRVDIVWQLFAAPPQGTVGAVDGLEAAFEGRPTAAACARLEREDSLDLLAALLETTLAEGKSGSVFGIADGFGLNGAVPLAAGLEDDVVGFELAHGSPP